MRLSVLLSLATFAWLSFSSPPSYAQESPQPIFPDRQTFAVTAAQADLARVDSMVDTLAAAGDLWLVSSQADRQLAGRTHDSFRQYHQGVPVHGGGVTRQRGAAGTVSIFGTLHEDIDVDVAPRQSAFDALTRARQLAGAEPATTALPELVVLPTLTGEYALAWSITMGDYHEYFLNAHTGELVQRQPLIQRQSAVGSGRGIQGAEKKVSMTRAGGRFEAHDRLRPAEIVTLDLRFSDARLIDLVLGMANWSASDIASSPVNTWSDAAVVDAHAYTGFSYDYFRSRHGWSGIDGRNGRTISMVNPGDEGPGYNNAFFAPPPFGPERTGVVVYGALEDGTPLTPIDVVAHELMHGVTYFSVSRRTGEGFSDNAWGVLGPARFTLDGRQFDCEWRFRVPEGPDAGRVLRFACRDGRLLLLSNHAGAINEAFSDIFGTGVEFSVHPPGDGVLRADYVMGEDAGGDPRRSLENPRSIRLGDSALLYPDAASRLFLFLLGVFEDTGEGFWLPVGSVDGRTIIPLPTDDDGGVHINSTILSHAFYLSIEGGRNRTTGLAVEGVGGVNRTLVERAFFRAMTDLMPSQPKFAMAAAVIRQSALDLYGTRSATYLAIDQALNAVGLPEVQ